MLKKGKQFGFKRANLLSKMGNLPKILGLIWDATRNWTIAWLVIISLQGFLPGFIVYSSKLVVNSLVTVTRDKGSWENLIVPTAVMAGALILTEVFQGALGWIRTVQSELLKDYLSGLIHTKSIAADLSFFENPEFYDRLDRARSDATSRSLSLLDNLGSLLQNSLTLATMAVILIPYGFWLPIILVVSMLPALGVVLRANREYHDWWTQSTGRRRAVQYYEMVLTLRDFAPEVRLFNLGEHYRVLYQTVQKQLRTESLRLMRNQGLAKLVASTSGLVVAGGVMFWMVRRVLQGLGTLGDLALFYQAFSRGQSLMRTLLGNVGQVYNSSLFINNLFEFLHIEPQIADPANAVQLSLPLKQGISLKNVSFRYPGSQSLTLENFSLDIPVGKTIAIVGDNGAGKSTLLKLICRFYDPESGSIEIDGINIKRFRVQELRNAIAIMFQYPIYYQDTAFQNIALSSLSNQASLEDIQKAAQGAGIHETIESLPQGYQTFLGKWLAEGSELSGGQWQRIALARAFFRQAPIVILDEPTSAMDSWAEAEWLEKFRDLAKGRTSIIITHRFTMAMRADTIYVMRSGKVVESGNHSQLIAQGGLYAESWKNQTELHHRDVELQDLAIG